MVVFTRSSSAEFRRLLDDASRRSGVNPERVMVRSNGVQEGLLQRGALASLPCSWDDVEQTLENLRKQALQVTSLPTHWIIQDQVAIHAQGQMSNERRVRYEKRDWAIEIEAYMENRPTKFRSRYAGGGTGRTSPKPLSFVKRRSRSAWS